MPGNAVRRLATPFSVLALCGMLVLSACAAKYAQVPARLDLRPYGRVALVAFSTEQEHSEVSRLATQRFAEAVLRSQSGIELLEVSPADPALGDRAARGDAAALAQVLGQEEEVPAVFVGHLKLSGVRPRGRLGPPGDLNVKASISAELTVRLVSVRTGGTMWRSSAAASGTLGRVALAGRVPSVAVRDADEVHGELIGSLVQDVTQDLRPTWVKQ